MTTARSIVPKKQKSKRKEFLQPGAYRFIILVLCLGIIGIIYILHNKNSYKYISPLPDSISWNHPVYAQESPQLETAQAVVRRLTGRHAGVLIRIAQCESGMNPRAVGPTSDYGLFQVHLPSHRSRIPGKTDDEKKEWLLEPNNNTMYAYALYLEQGTDPWRSSHRCHGL